MRQIYEPTLELFWWDWQRETYVDVREDDRGVVVMAPGRVVTGSRRSVATFELVSPDGGETRLLAVFPVSAERL
jgi:hypothetical protein